MLKLSQRSNWLRQTVMCEFVSKLIWLGEGSKEEIQKQFQPLSHRELFICKQKQRSESWARLNRSSQDPGLSCQSISTFQKDIRVKAVRAKGTSESWTLPMRVTGTPYSRAEMAVHFPVPFCPALSLIFGSRYLPSVSWNLRILAVISIRNESSSVLFHSSNAYVQDVRKQYERSKDHTEGPLTDSLSYVKTDECSQLAQHRGSQAPLYSAPILLPPAEASTNQESVVFGLHLVMLIFWRPELFLPEHTLLPHLLRGLPGSPLTPTSSSF